MPSIDAICKEVFPSISLILISSFKFVKKYTASLELLNDALFKLFLPMKNILLVLILLKNINLFLFKILKI